MPISPSNLPTPLGGISKPAFEPFATRGASREQIQFDKASYDLLTPLINGTSSVRGLELEHRVSNAISEHYNIAPEGLLVPASTWCRDSVGDTAGALVETHVEPTIAAALQPYSACLAAGARKITGLRSNFALPVWQAAPFPSGLAENVQVVSFPGDNFALQKMSPYRASVDMLVTRQELTQAAPDFGLFFREQFNRSLASKVDNWIPWPTKPEP